MTQTFWPFPKGSAGSLVDNSDYSLMGRNWLPNGVVRGALNELKISADGTAMQVTADTGAAHVMGPWFKNDALTTLQIAAADATNPRIDVIAIRVDWSANTVAFAVLTGTPAASPTPPSLTQNDILSGGARWEIPLANVNVSAGVTVINAGDVEDRRFFTDPKFDVTLFGAQGDGVTDDTSAIQNAINAAYAIGGGTIYFPRRGVYILNGGLQDTTGANAILLLPQNSATTTAPVTIELEGPFVPPTGYPEGGSMPAPQNAVVLFAKTPPSGNYPCVIGGPGGSEGWTNITFVMKNITVRCGNNPGYQAIQTYHVANVILENVVVDVDAVIDSGVAEPTVVNSAALVLPGVDNYGVVRVTNFYGIGYYLGIQYSEHARLENIFLQECYYPLYPVQGNHAATLGRVLVQWCPTVIMSAGQTSYFTIEMLDIEDSDSTTAWYKPIYHVDDPNNTLHGLITAHRVLQGTGAVSGLTNNGGTGLTITQI